LATLHPLEPVKLTTILTTDPMDNDNGNNDDNGNDNPPQPEDHEHCIDDCLQPVDLLAIQQEIHDTMNSMKSFLASLIAPRDNIINNNKPPNIQLTLTT